MHDLQQLALIWASVFIASWLAAKTKLTPVLYFLAAGCVMVNLGWLPEHSTPFIAGISEVGIILIMFALGFEANPGYFIRSVKRSWGIALFGALAPFIAAYSCAQYFWGDDKIAMLCGLTMTATAVSLTMVSLKSEGLHLSGAANGIMTSAIIDDIASLALVAVVIPIATGTGDLSVAGIAAIVLRALLFFVLIVVIATWIMPHSAEKGLLKRYPFLQRFGMANLLAIDNGSKATLGILLVAISISLLAHYLGLHPAIGAYMAGLIIKEEYFHFGESGKRRALYQDTRRIIDDVAFSWIGPIFFVNLGTELVFDADIFTSVLDEALLLLCSVFFAQIISAAAAARYTGNFNWQDSVMIGFGMLGRAELAFVVMNIAYIQHGIFTEEVFYILMITIFWLNVAVPVTIRFWRPYYSGEKPLPGFLGAGD